MKMYIFFLFVLIAATASAQNYLADKLAGTYKGLFQSPSISAPITDYQITVTKIDSVHIKIAPLAGTVSTSFEAKLSEQFGMIMLKATSDIIAVSGTYSDLNGRLSYSYHLGGAENRNIEVFLGTKEE